MFIILKGRYCESPKIYHTNNISLMQTSYLCDGKSLSSFLTAMFALKERTQTTACLSVLFHVLLYYSSAIALYLIWFYNEFPKS